MKTRLLALVITIAALSSACAGNVFSLGVGDCFDDPSGDATEITSVPMQECGDPHTNEVFATFELTNIVYPGDDATFELAATGCFDRFEAFVGRDYQSSALDFSVLTPTSESWDQDDREVVCFLFDLDQTQKLTGSMRGSGV